jgi:hypothetical protein
MEIKMTERAPGYYWVDWRAGWVDDEPDRRPGPLVGEWDGRVWWFSRLDTYRFDSQVEVIADCPAPAARPNPDTKINFLGRLEDGKAA